jgi:DNA primase
LIPREKIDDVRERTNIVEVTKRHVELKRAGTASWKGLCPFHSEKTPSFHVHESRQFFHCFGCGEKGDVFAFLTKIEQRSFVEVLRDLAREAGVELPERSMTSAERQALAEAESERERMLRAVDLAARFFETQLLSPAGAAAREYLAGRGISPQTAARFRVGYAPAGWDVLQRHLKAEQVPLLLAERLGLVGAHERGQYDFFRDRVMLPVMDRQKRPVGFSSRLLDPEAKERKYVNSPDSPLFHKKEQLYGLPFAIDAMRRSGLAIIVEGNFDVLSLHEAGIEEAVAPMGTALTEQQMTQVGRIASRVVVVFDGDEAGERAAKKCVPLFVDADVDGRVARLPHGVDPDDFVRNQGADAFRRLVDGAVPAVDYFVDCLSREAADPTVPGRVHLLEQAAPLLASLRSEAARTLYVARVAAMLGVGQRDVERAVRAARIGRRPDAPAAIPTAPPAMAPRRDLPPEELESLVLLVSRPDLARMPEARRALDLLTDPGLRVLYRAALERLEGGGRLDVPAWLDEGPAEVRPTVAAAMMDDRYEGFEGADRALRSLVQRLERARIEAEIAQTKIELERARKSGDESAVRAISLREIELIRTKLGLSRSPEAC